MPTTLRSTLAVLAALSAATSAPAAPDTRIGDWVVASAGDGRAGSSACQARLDGRDGIGLILAASAGDRWSMGLAGNLGGSPGASYPVRLRVDRGPVRTVAATVDPSGVARIPIVNPDGFLEDMRRGTVLQADAGAERLSFPLRETRAVIEALLRCAGGEGTRVAGAEGGRAASASPVSAEKRLEAMTLAVNILSRAGVTGFELQPAAAPETLGGHDVTWRAGEVFGSLRNVQTPADGGPTDVRAVLAARDLRACDGGFTAEAGAVADREGATLMTVCSGASGQASFYATVVRGPREGYVLSLVSPPEKVEALKAAAGKLRGPAAEIIGKAR